MHEPFPQNPLPPSSTRPVLRTLTLVSDTGREASDDVVVNARADWAILMSQAQGGDELAYRQLLEEITPYVRHLARRALPSAGDCEDAVQETLLSVHAVRHTFDPARPFSPWLTAIVRRRVIDVLRREGRRREESLSEEHEGIEQPQEASPGTIDIEALQQALGALPEAQRQAISLLKIDGLSLKEASAASGSSIASLKVATHRAMRSLERLLKGTP